MKHVITGQDSIVGPWVAKRSGGGWFPGRGVTIGVADDVEGLVAGAIFENYNGANVFIHCASDGGKQWLNREVLWFTFYYPFVQLNVKRITATIASSNKACINFITAAGFSLEATLPFAHPDGDLLIFSLFKEDCRWLHIKERTSPWDRATHPRHQIT